MYNKNLSHFIYWDIQSFLLIICSLQLAILGAIGLDEIGLKIPILRQLIGFIYLSFVPGILIIRLLKLKNLKNTEILLYAIGLSIFTLMFTGFLINIVGLHFVSNPISTINLISTISFIVIILSYACYKSDSGTATYICEEKYEKNIFLSPSALFLMLIPSLSVLGTYIVNYYSNNNLLLFVIIIVCFVVLLIGFNTQLIHKDLYPLAIFVIAISLLFHNSLIFTYLHGWDVHQEYYFSNLVKTSGVWNSHLPSNLNAMLSIVFLAPIYSDICNLSLTWVFKIVFPVIFSFVPLGVFHVYQKQTENDNTAFLSAIYFMSISTFYTEMLGLERQEIAELFFVILIAIIVSNVELSKKRLLTLVFTFGMVISHYGLSYLLLFLILIGYLFLKYVLNSRSCILNLSFILIFFIYTVLWYLSFAEGSLFQTIVSLFSHYYNTMFEEVFATQSTQLIVSSAYSFWGNVLKLLYMTSQFFMVVGFAYVLKNHKKLAFSKEFIAFSFMLFCALGSSLVYSNTGMNLHRLFHIASIALSVYFVVGISVSLSVTGSFINKIYQFGNIKPEKISTLFIILFLLINIGFVQEISNKDQISRSLSQKSILINEDDSTYDKMFLASSRSIYREYIPTQDFYGTTWLSKNRNPMEKIYVDSTAKYIVFYSYGMMPYNQEPNKPLIKDLSISPIEPNAYVYLKYTNVIYGLVSNGLFADLKDAYFKINEFFPVINSKSKIYTNGANYVFK